MDNMITSGQKEQGVNVIAAAARKGGAEAIEQLSKNKVLNVGNFQRVLAQGDKVAETVKAAMMTALTELAENVVDRLKRIFPERTIELAETDGKETLATAKDVFTGGIYNAVKRGPCKATAKTITAVYEMIKDGTYTQLFGGFGENLNRLCWTESQIVAFCRDYRDLLRKDGYGTFFLFEGENGGFFVVGVGFGASGRLGVFVDPLADDDVWSAYYQHRVVVPQL